MNSSYCVVSVLVRAVLFALRASFAMLSLSFEQKEETTWSTLKNAHCLIVLEILALQTLTGGGSIANHLTGCYASYLLFQQRDLARSSC